jgi:Na+/glutamate symporter
MMNSQLQELFFAFGVTAFAMLAGLLVTRARSHAYWRWPLYSAMTMVLGVVLWNLMQAHLFPPDWHFSHPRALYFSAVALYFLLGLALGLLLGRLTGRKTPGSDEKEPT